MGILGQEFKLKAAEGYNPAVFAGLGVAPDALALAAAQEFDPGDDAPFAKNANELITGTSRAVYAAEGSVAGFIVAGARPMLGEEDAKKKKDEEQDALKNLLLERDRDQLRRQLEERIAAIDAELAALEKDMDITKAALAKAGDAKARLARGERLERDADGSLKDKELEALLRDYERRTGLRVDRGDAKALDQALDAVGAEQGAKLQSQEKKKLSLQEERKLCQEGIGRLQKGEDPEKVREDLLDKGVNPKALEKAEDAKVLKKQLATYAKNLDNKISAQDTPAADVDAEIEAFQKKLSRAKALSGGVGLRAEMQDDIDKLSPEARIVLAAGEDTKFLFEDDPGKPAAPEKGGSQKPANKSPAAPAA